MDQMVGSSNLPRRPNKIRGLQISVFNPFCLFTALGAKIGAKISFYPPFLSCKNALFRDMQN